MIGTSFYLYCRIGLDIDELYFMISDFRFDKLQLGPLFDSPPKCTIGDI